MQLSCLGHRLFACAGSLVIGVGITASEPDRPRDLSFGSALLAPMLQQAPRLMDTHPPVRAARLTLRQRALEEEAVAAHLAPLFDSSVAYESRSHPNDPDAEGARSREDTEARISTGIQKRFSTGTTLRLEGVSERRERFGTGADRVPSYEQTVQLTIQQALLKGWQDRQFDFDQIEAAYQVWLATEELDETSESALLDLSEDWLDLVATEAERLLRAAELADSEGRLKDRQAEAEAGFIKGRDLATLRRDMVEQQADLERVQRRQRRELSQVRIRWPGLELATLALPKDLVVPEQPVVAPPFAETRSGRTQLQRLSLATARIEATRVQRRDRLDLELRLGYRGEDRDYSRAWREVGRLDHEEFSVGLRYERRFGADEDRVRYRQAILEQDRLEETAVQSERNWQIERLALVEDWLGRRADLAEQRALEEAYRSELESLQAEAKEGLLQARDLVDTQEDLRDAQVALVYARVDLIRAELRIHAHDDRLGERLLSP